jgi:hypothetical protein
LFAVTFKGMVRSLNKSYRNTISGLLRKGREMMGEMQALRERVKVSHCRQGQMGRSQQEHHEGR